MSVNIRKSKKTTKLVSSETIDETCERGLKPLIKWSGGKGDEIKQFSKYLPQEYDTY